MRNHKYYVTVMGIRADESLAFTDYFVEAKNFRTKEGINNFLDQVKKFENLQSCFILNVIKLKR